MNIFRYFWGDKASEAASQHFIINTDMDNQNLPLTPEQEQGHALEATGTETLNETTSTTAPQPEAETEAEEIMTEGIEDASEAEEKELEETRELTVEDLLERAKSMLEKDPAEVSADDIRRMRALFGMLRKSAVTAEAAEGEEAAESAADAQIDVEFADTIERLRARKAEWAAAQEAARAENLRRKNDIIEQIIALAEDTDNVNRTFPRYRELQDEFNAVGDVDPTEETSVWKRFQEAREKYSDNLKINKELRDYDFKKNLEEKEALIVEVTSFAADEDIIGAYRRLQDIHNKWRQIGPVAKELREEIWERFRAASTEINKRYQAFFEARKAREAENEAGKTALCEKAEALDYKTLTTAADWEKMTEEIRSIQEEWRTFGFASKKVNRQLFARFRAACDAFFAAKAEYYRSRREALNDNVRRKQELVEAAEALKDSTDWRRDTDRFVQMQQDWKAIGAVPRKLADELWERFRAACDTFFDNKKKATSGVRGEQAANLKIKREIIGMLSALIEGAEKEKDAVIAELKTLQDRWRETGHVPFREKEKIQEAYRSAVDAVRKHFALAESKARRERFEANVAQLEGDDNKLFRERERLLKTLETRRADLRTYENNLGFLSAKSRSGSSLMLDMERRIERLKADIAETEEKVKLIDSKISAKS